uniref:RBR-type E3 ubiquitin transferase n=2 Tax=Haemonchus contortus TaxID=6289 RepID=A0A7I4YSS0_HAECO
ARGRVVCRSCGLQEEVFVVITYFFCHQSTVLPSTMDADDLYDSADDDIDDYYNDYDDDMNPDEELKKSESEDAEFECLNVFQVERVLNESVAALAEKEVISPTLARMLLHANEWDVNKVSSLLLTNGAATLRSSGILPPGAATVSRQSSALSYCAVCAEEGLLEMRALACGHAFCAMCWRLHIEAKISEGVASRLECMEPSCPLLCPSEFVLRILDKPQFRARYERFVFRDYVSSHPELKFCVGKDCQTVIRSKEKKPKRVTCSSCNTSFCVACGVDYHAPTSCETIKQWLLKCADDSETANYISAHTKDCPQCHSCIEKNGGCNHMQCAKCKHHFCWMCFGDWKTHGSEYYECSRYKENPSVAAEANHVKARRALEKYLHYYERFENHSKSLKLEQQFRDKIQRKIEAKVNDHDGTWIDWQYLHNAATLLTKCRYTLQYTYPFAYFMENGARKQLFEYQQAQLEKEVEELAWAVERADSTARGALEAHMHRAEHKRTSLLHDFFF